MRDSKKGVERGQSITFRVPSDTPDHLLKQLQNLKETERRNFSSKIAQYVLRGVSESLAKERETVTIPLPKQLTKEQRNWIKHEHSEALIGSILYQLLMDPMRATTLLASLNSKSVNIEEALYLQEEAATTLPSEKSKEVQPNEERKWNEIESELDDLSLDNLQDELHSQMDQEENLDEDDDPLGDFLSSMNK
ncbi:hypothetical protein [Alkalihalobacillus sp. AL-G]|uniref:hypothetical protein n=1 Tax=Alkalihalobacillus sp. AL-G TaxID=2926399 RepID=UPI00272ACAD3|nr:hypothetical protein [Alkalihalobacillus sp. AL-G]WLD93321.1 hypothetical protein MOJ78_20385 [Alkalihalobacillus sp. AL-G]